MLRHNLVHLMASDGHASMGFRMPVMREAAAVVERWIGEEAAQCLTVTNPSAVLADAPVSLPVAKLHRRKFFLSLGR